LISFLTILEINGNTLAQQEAMKSNPYLRLLFTTLGFGKAEEPKDNGG